MGIMNYTLFHTIIKVSSFEFYHLESSIIQTYPSASGIPSRKPLQESTAAKESEKKNSRNRSQIVSEDRRRPNNLPFQSHSTHNHLVV